MYCICATLKSGRVELTEILIKKIILSSLSGFSHIFVSFRGSELQATISGAVIRRYTETAQYDFEIRFRSTQRDPTLVAVYLGCDCNHSLN